MVTGTEAPLIFDATKLSRSELEAEVVFQAKLLEKVSKAIMWTDELEDDGDRVYFASTNHADHQKEVFQEISELELERAIFPESGRDLYADLRELRKRVRALTKAITDLDCSTILGVAESCASGNPHWEMVSGRIEVARALAKGEQTNG